LLLPQREDLSRSDNKIARTAFNRLMPVDDQPDVIFTLKAIFEQCGDFSIDVFNNPQRSLIDFKPGYYDLRPATAVKSILGRMSIGI